MKMSTLNNLDIAILEPHGSLIGGEETDELRKKSKDLIEQGNRKMIIDLQHVTYINSTGIGSLVSIHSMYANSNGKVKLCGIGKNVENVFVITRLMSVFDVDETRAAAIKTFSNVKP